MLQSTFNRKMFNLKESDDSSFCKILHNNDYDSQAVYSFFFLPFSFVVVLYAFLDYAPFNAHVIHMII